MISRHWDVYFRWNPIFRLLLWSLRTCCVLQLVRATPEGGNALLLLPWIAPFISFKKICLVTSLRLHRWHRTESSGYIFFSPNSSLCQREIPELTSKMNIHLQQRKLGPFQQHLSPLDCWAILLSSGSRGLDCLSFPQAFFIQPRAVLRCGLCKAGMGCLQYNTVLNTAVS